jgi:hypothetical protein
VPRVPTLLVLATLAPAAARAQLVGVPAPPPRPAASVPQVAADTASGPRPWRADTAAIVQRLDIQAWVDSAAPALARAPRPAPAVTAPVPRVEPAPPPPIAAPSRRPAPRRPSAEARRDTTAAPRTPAAPPR